MAGEVRGTPVRWLEDCREHLSANANCREHHYRITGYADRDGRLLALDCVANVDAGAYSVIPHPRSRRRRWRACCRGPTIFTPTAVVPPRWRPTSAPSFPIAAWHGPACLAVEVIMDAIARQAGIEPYEVRLRNLVHPDQMPFENVVKKQFDGGDYPESMRRAVAAIGLPAIRERQRRARTAADRRRGLDLLRAGRNGNRGAGGMGSARRAGI